MGMTPTDGGRWLRQTIQGFIAGAPENRMGIQGAEPIFDSPLVGFSNGADPLYDEYVRHIGAFYLNTEKAMNAYMKAHFGIDTYACGLCQTGVPCTDHIPRPEEGE